MGHWVFDSLGLIQINPNQIWFILPPRHSCQVIIWKNILYAKHAQYSLGMCNFPFQVWSLWGCKIMFLVKETVPQINGVPVPVERSWSSLKGVLHIYKEIVWLKGLLHIVKPWCNFQKRQLIQFYFWWVKPFLQTNGVPSKQMAAGFLWKERYILFKEMVLLSNIKASWASLRGMLHLWRTHCIFWHNVVSVV